MVTGASRGIGREISIRLAREGYDLALTARDSAALEETARLSREEGGEATVIVADLASTEAPEMIAREVSKLAPRLDLFVSNAGIAVGGSVERTSREEWDAMMGVNTRAPFLLMKSLLSLLRGSSEAVVVVISSVVGRIGYAGQAAYAASKHALTGLTKAFAREVHSEGIRVHLVSPGGVATDMITITRPDLDHEGLISPADVARTVLFLCTQPGVGLVDEINIRRSAATPWG